MTVKADVMVVTVTDIETQALSEIVTKASGQDPTPITINDRTYHDLGLVNGAKIVLALSEMGAGGLGGAQNTVLKGIEALNPNAVFMIGIAFGIDHTKQAIGDILISEQLRMYELQRVSKDEIILRDDKAHASSRLLNHCKGSILYWKGAKVQIGTILTGDKLVDNLDYREQLKKYEPEAIGGEMEGQGLYVSCQDKKVDWVLIKGICDWADGNKGNKNKKEDQRIAANNAAKFFLCVAENTKLLSQINNTDNNIIEKIKDKLKLSIPNGLTFEQCVLVIGKAGRVIVNFEGFTNEDLKVLLPSSDINAENITNALIQLHSVSNKIPQYKVKIANGIYYVQKGGGGK